MISSLPGSQETSIVTIAELETLFLSVQRKVIGCLYKKIHNHEDAEDVAQETFVKAFRAIHAGTHVPHTHFSAWIFRIADNTALDHLRYQQHHMTISLSAYGEEWESGVILSETQNMPVLEGGKKFENDLIDQELLHELFKQLTPIDRACLLQYAVYGFSCQEISDHLQMSLPAIKARLKRSRDKCRRQFLQQQKESA